MNVQHGHKIYLQNLDEEGRMVLVNDKPLSGDPMEITHGDKINFENCVVLVYETDPNATQPDDGSPNNGHGGTEPLEDSLTGSEVGAGEEEDDEGAEEGLGEEEGESEEGEEEDAEGREEEEDDEEDEEGEEESMEDVEGGKHDSGGMEGITAAAEEAAAAAQLSRKRKSDYLQSGDIDPEAEPDADGGSGDNTATAANNLNGQPHTGPDGLSVALKLPPTTTTTSTTEDATQPEEGASVAEDNSRFRHLTLDRILSEGLVGEGSVGHVEIVKDSTNALCLLMRFPNALRSERGRQLAVGLPDLSGDLEEARNAARQRAALPHAKRLKQEPARVGGTAMRPGASRISTATRPTAGTRTITAGASRVLPPNKRLTAAGSTSKSSQATTTGRTTANSAAAALNARQRVIVGKKKAAAAALNAHRAEEAAISEADQEEDDNYEDEGNVGSKKKKHNNNIKLKPKKSGGKKQHISAKGTLLWSAEKVLREEKKPMKASEIISKGREKDSKGAANSLVGRFSTSIRQDPNSPFIRVASATYGLKEYAHLSSYKNYVETSPEQ
ncbi:uncharacterized protein ACA1_138940 [Acanthamoeba castellanii str. Neff]|uniref:HTH HARE-type domain-containing protein n=1 Tax=Acanthamoeba castellanii (strain ATCC 30010 / Neff) TaxID=1257118 RepID=L8GMK3_ACACF|nr:uncharacterized protein ACA1_138940 [Acanthamoeba castellanii str. Neff]ELR14207.1 hypothetical protein ACA1_138940 [Acanthamoeba castellanii str. Neff]